MRTETLDKIESCKTFYAFFQKRKFPNLLIGNGFTLSNPYYSFVKQGSGLYMCVLSMKILIRAYWILKLSSPKRFICSGLKHTVSSINHCLIATVKIL